MKILSSSNPVIIKKGYIFLGTLIILVFFIVTNPFTYLIQAHAESDNTETPEVVINVKDYKWKSGGMGRPGIIGEIILENTGKDDYENIELEVDFYSNNDIPLGSLRSTINDVLQSGTTKTFKNISLGIMHSELQRTIVRVVGAEKIEKGTPGQPKDLILVDSWEWTGGQFATEGILKEITLQNRSKNNYANIKIGVQFVGVQGPKVGIEGYTSRAVIHDVLPAKSKRTYKGINVGFRHPEAKQVVITVTDADKISVKEIKYRLAKRGESIELEEEEGTKRVKRKSLAERYRQERGLEDESKEIAKEGEVKVSEEREQIDTEDRKKLSLAERYQTEVLNQPVEDEPQISIIERYKRRILAESSEEFISPTFSSNAGLIESEYKIGNDHDVASTEGKEASGGESNSETNKSSDDVGNKGATTEQPTEGAEEEEVPLPQRDIVVKDFKLGGGGVPQTMGVLSELTLENISGITYSKIELEIGFYAYEGHRSLGSNFVTLYEILPPNSVKEFKNIEFGMISLIPEVVDVKVLDAVAID